MHVFCELVEVPMYDMLVCCVEYVVKEACHLCANLLVVVCFGVVKVYGVKSIVVCPSVAGWRSLARTVRACHANCGVAVLGA